MQQDLDALGPSGRARVIAGRVRHLQTHLLELTLTQLVNGDSDDDVVPGLGDSPTTYKEEMERTGKLIQKLGQLYPTERDALIAACAELSA